MIIEYKRYVHMNIIDTQTTILSPNSSNIFFFLFLGAVEDNSNPVPLWQKMTWTELSPQSHTIMWPSLLLDTLCGLQVLLDVFNYLTISVNSDLLQVLEHLPLIFFFFVIKY